MTQTGHRLAGVRVNMRRRPRVGQALSGSGARGLAPIGVLKVLEREALVERRKRHCHRCQTACAKS